LDPRLKTQYYINNSWKDYYIEEALIVIRNIWEKNYMDVTSMNIVSSEDETDELYAHIFKKHKNNNKDDELTIYLNEPIVNIKTDIIKW
jgi:hypothetical protein